MQINGLLNVLMSAPGIAGSPPISPLAGGLLGTPASAGTIGDKFAGLLGQQGMQPQLGLSDTNNPTGDTESSPQELGIALPVLGTYIDTAHTAAKNVLTGDNINNNISLDSGKKNLASASLDDSKKNLIPAQILQASKATKVIPSGKAVVKDMTAASELSNEQEFQKLVQNLEQIKPDNGKIKLEGLDESALQKNDQVLSKLAEHLKNSTQKQTAETNADANTNPAMQEGDIIAKAGAKSDSSTDLLNTFKDMTGKSSAKTEDKIEGVKFSLDDAHVTNVKHHDLHNQLKELKLEQKAPLIAASEQVQVKIAQAVKDGVDMIRIKLHPEDLGNVDIQLDVETNGNTSIRIIAEKAETLDMLRKDSQALERALRDTGVKADASGLQFSLRENNGQQNFTNSGSSGKYKTSAAAISNEKVAAVSREYNLSLGLGTDRVDILA